MINRRSLLKTALAALVPAQLRRSPRIRMGTLDPNARYMVIVDPVDDRAEDWRWRREISEEIRDCFQAAGFERGDVGILFLRGYSAEITEVK